MLDQIAGHDNLELFKDLYGIEEPPGECGTLALAGILLAPFLSEAAVFRRPEAKSIHKKEGAGFLSILIVCVPFEGDPQETRWTDLFWVSASARCFVGATAGFNPAEFVDFLLGWFGVDIAGDDDRESKAADGDGASEEKAEEKRE
ncbi:MAG: hypothetical protein MUC63_08685 [Planctomycetes bacterium]|nr:hypothetical protein [Planctomycetota bacterium]